MTAAIYHGSLVDVHGPVTVLGECPCNDCHRQWEAYRLRPDDWQVPDVRWLLRAADGRELEHVRPGSFTRAPHRRGRWPRERPA
ncbi:MAG: hypothetical protein GEU83_11650 [Pseudonocardiaceae bacterium]|nr:hypothetical protein [Pseudonocardiaceae bacterium]